MQSASQPQKLSPDSAFVVHLIPEAGQSPASGVTGRVEHVATGKALRFGSSTELLEFMRHVVRGQHDD
jgi:hypothetical protein